MCTKNIKSRRWNRSTIRWKFLKVDESGDLRSPIYGQLWQKDREVVTTNSTPDLGIHVFVTKADALAAVKYWVVGSFLIGRDQFCLAKVRVKGFRHAGRWEDLPKTKVEVYDSATLLATFPFTSPKVADKQTASA